MNIALEITKVGSGLGLVLPPEALADFGFKEGMQVSVSKTTGGMLVQRDDEFEAHMKLVDEAFERYGETLRDLAQ